MGVNHYLDSLGSKVLLQPTLGATLAWAIHTLIESSIFAHSVAGLDLNAIDQYNQLKWFIFRNLTNWVIKNQNHT